jgi:hypothetical protein
VDLILRVEQQVARLHVAMHDALRMRVIECLRSLLEPAKGHSRRRRPRRSQPLLEGAAAHVLHHDVRLPSGLADVEDRDDVRVAREPRRRARLAGKAPLHRFVVDVRRREELQRDNASQHRVGGAIDVAHRAARDQLRIAVALGKGVRSHCHSGCRATRLVPNGTIGRREGSVKEGSSPLA